MAIQTGMRPGIQTHHHTGSNVIEPRAVLADIGKMACAARLAARLKIDELMTYLGVPRAGIMRL